MRISILPYAGEDFYLIGPMLLRWGHTVCSLDDGPDLVFVFRESTRDSLPKAEVGSRRVVLVDKEPDSDSIPHGWERCRRDGLMDYLMRFLGMPRGEG